MKLLVYLFLSFCLTSTVWSRPQSSTAPFEEESSQESVTLTQEEDRIVVKFGDELFTQYIFKGYEKPILYPVMAPGEVAITRHYPMEKGKAGEATDHPHQKSIFFAHGNINGHNFWNLGGGTIVIDKVVSTQQSESRGFITSTHLWKTAENETLLKDETTLTFRQQGNTRSIEYQVKLIASEQDLNFVDDKLSKEGTMAIRTHPALRLVHKDKRKKAAGRAINSEGTTGKAIWGEKAKWVLYQGPIEDQNYAIAMFDHPKNLRHPTTWHARHYGLVAANPFGISHFLKEESGAGDYTLKEGDSLTLRYLFVFTQGEVSPEDVEARFSEWTEKE